MGRLFFILVFAAAMVLPGCSKEDVGNGDNMPVGFSACGEWNLLTRDGDDNNSPDDNTEEEEGVADPSKTGFMEGDSLRVFGHYRMNGEDVKGVAPNFMYAQPVVLTGDGWYYSPLKYWPNNKGDLLDFYAYTPLNKNISISPANQMGPPVISYKLRAEDEAITDILFAEKRSVEKPAANGKTQLVFRHLMGKLQFKFSVLPPKGAFDENGQEITENNGQYTAVVKSMSYSINTQGVFNYTYDNEDLPVWNVVEGGENTKRVLNRETLGEGSVVSTGEFIHEFTAFLLPVSIEKFSVGLSTDGGSTYSIREVTLSGKDVIEVIAGKVTTVNMTIQQGEVVTLKIEVTTQPWFEKNTDTTFPIN
ncbi:MAG: fimbrillin family protein [Bacteroidales bacterium]|nr:fimbrillin family protein [Bacteroidales bacterium]